VGGLAILGIFIVALIASWVVFDYVSRAYVCWMEENTWGREIAGLLMVGFAVILTWIVVRLLHLAGILV
jgi:hypothetical protein